MGTGGERGVGGRGQGQLRPPARQERQWAAGGGDVADWSIGVPQPQWSGVLAVLPLVVAVVAAFATV